jgi:DNA-binding NtrC family response regulator
MADIIKFLLVEDSGNQYWTEVLREALAQLGQLSVTRASESINSIIDGSFQVVIVDEAASDNLSLLVARIRAQRPEIAVVVATASPSWTGAREVFRSGATDYIRKTFDRNETAAAIKATIPKPGTLR